MRNDVGEIDPREEIVQEMINTKVDDVRPRQVDAGKGQILVIEKEGIIIVVMMIDTEGREMTEKEGRDRLLPHQ